MFSRLLSGGRGDGCAPEFDGQKRLTCAYCTALFTPRRATQVCCSRDCRTNARRGSKSSKIPRKETCIQCGSAYETTSGKNKIYCSNKCKVMAWSLANPERRAIQRERAKPLPHSKVFFNTCRVCGKGWTGQSSSLICSAACNSVDWHRIAAKEIVCADCKTVFCPTYEASRGRPSIRCQVCHDEKNRLRTAIYRIARKAKQKTATVERVDPRKVFDRDKWHCQECGVATPREKRGTYDDDAPELDHIKPLSKGGAHSYSNTQCLCRRCNGEKSDKWQPQEDVNLLLA